MRNTEAEEWQVLAEERNEKGKVHAIERQLTFPLIKSYKVCTGSQQGTWPERQ